MQAPSLDTIRTDEVFALDVQVITDPNPDMAASRCSTDDGCASTCASSCASRG